MCQNAPPMAQDRASAGYIQQRLLNQGIALPTRTSAASVVEWLGAVQAQEYQPAKWALGLRMRDATDDAV